MKPALAISIFLLAAAIGVAAQSDARKVDEFGAIRTADRNARLDNFAIEMQNDPHNTAYVIAYGGRKSRPGTVAATLKSVKNYLFNTRGVDGRRIVTVDGGYQEDPMIELWVVPSGAAPPQASPTVDPSEVKVPVKRKPAPKRRTTGKRG